MRVLRWAPATALLVFLSIRLLDLALFAYFGHHQAPLQAGSGAVFPAQRSGDGLAGILTSWDGQWYRRIAEEGYPRTLPTDHGVVVQNAWAFYPAVPLLVGATTALTGLPFAWAACVLDLACACAAVVVLHRMVARHSSPTAATWTVIGLAIAPAAPVVLMAYTEGPALLVLALALEALSRERYRSAAAWTLVLGLVRPIAPAIGLAAVGLALMRRRRSTSPEPDWRGATLVAGTSLVSFAVWPLTAALVTGRADAYTATQANWLADSAALVDRSWLLSAVSLQRPALSLAVALAAVTLIWLVSRRAARAAWPAELRAWAVAYAFFIALSTRPVSSITRYLLLTVVPWWSAPEIATRPRAIQVLGMILAVLVAVLGHTWWIAIYVRSTVTGPSPSFP